MSRLLLSLLSLVLIHPAVRAAEPPKDASTPAAPSVEKLAAKVRPSVVVVTVQGRDGKREGLGTGFVVSADGLIATNLHVIGEGRAVTVETADGKKYDVTAIHASDRHLDLAVVKIAARGLAPLELGDSSTLKEGEAVVAIGNPQGLKHSVVAGVVSGLREIDGRALIQLAMPIEAGNSGGPLLDMQGRVHGLLTIKSLVTDNLGFAVAVNALKPLLAKPNPVPMSAWLTIGALDADEWEPLMGAHWSQRAGRIKVEGAGQGFGGRSLCLSRRPTPAAPFELAVSVHLDDEAGAAGLAFYADGGDRHYGFYPTNGKLRLTRFDGPDVFSWTILEDRASTHYRPGEWNTLKVRLEKGRILCFVNDKLVIESKDAGLTEGRVGLAKFRDTKAQFKQFRMGKQVAPAALPAQTAARLGKLIDALPPEGKLTAEEIGRLAPEGPAGPALLRERARRLEEQAARLRQLAAAVGQRAILDELARVTAGKDENVDLLRAALLLARLDNDDVDVEAYRTEVERMARKVADRLAKDATESDKIEALNRYFFKERGFHGSRADYYNRSNSYLSEVIDDREGLPITLALLYMELARRLGLKVEGVGLPGHFVVRHVPAKGEPRLIDVYEGGTTLSREEAAGKVEAITGRPLREAHLAAIGKKAIVVRMLHNLLNVADREKDAAGLLRYLDAIVAVDPEAAEARALRAGVLYQQGDRQAALKDVDWLLEHEPEGLDLDRVRQMRRILTRPEN
jgi:regulator of sirC expression with transglutaminase-like and TPR domain/S1-C subfamily serine protease